MAVTGGSSNKNNLFDVIQKLDHLELFKYYTGGLYPDDPSNSPLRKNDTVPSFLYGTTDHGVKFIDFGTGEKGSIIDFVRLKFKCNLSEAVNIIANDFNVNSSKKQYGSEVIGVIPRKVKTIQIRASIWNPFYLKYWFEYGISKTTLNFFNVVPITHYWVSGKMKICERSYAYRIFDRFKILNLDVDKADKWRTNCSELYWQGLEQLPDKGDLLIITSSLKDVMVLYELGYTAIAPPSEIGNIPESILVKLKRRFKQIVVLYDNDENGLKQAASLQDKYQFPFITMDTCKDPSDYSKQYGLMKLGDTLNHLLWQIDQK